MHRRSPALAFAVLLLAAVSGCGHPKSHDEQVAELRSQYTAKLNGFAVKEQPTAGAMGDMGQMGAQEGMPGSEGAQPAAPAPSAPPPQGGEEVQSGDLAVPPAPTPVHQSAILDILVSRKGRVGLPGLTVDITQADPQGHEKGHWQAYLDVSSVLPGSGTQISYTLDDVQYQEGDGFYVEVREPVPAAERGEYREFQESGPTDKGA